MTREEFDALVQRVEFRYSGREAALERSLTRWLAIGLAGMLFWLLLLGFLGLSLFALGTIAEPPTGPILIVFGSLMMLYGGYQLFFLTTAEPDQPEGRLVEQGDVPALFSMLEGLRLDLQCRAFDEVRITFALNAGVREVGRPGPFRPSRTILEIGLPLAASMPVEELKAILAHEYIHLSSRHGRSSRRIHRLNQTWGRLFQKLATPATSSFTRRGRLVIARFVDWFWPRLRARTLVLSRAHERKADCEAARVAGALEMGRALWRVEVLSPWLSERFWPGILAEAAEHPEPPVDIADRLTVAIQSPPTPEDAKLWSSRGMVRATLRDDTHPALVDRVRPLELTPDDLGRFSFPEPPKTSAAKALFGEALPAIERELSRTWRDEAIGPWRDRHRRSKAEARRKASATASPTASPLIADVHDLWALARKEVEVRGAAAAVPLLRQLLERDPTHDGASVVLGRHLAISGDPEGESLLLGVLDRDQDGWLPGACQALFELYRASGRTDRFAEIRARLDRHESELKAAQAERASITAKDRFEPHLLEEKSLTQLRERLAATPGLGAAWLVRKKVRHFPGRPMFVLCVRGSGRRWWSNTSDKEQALVRWLVPRVELPGQVLVIPRHGAFQALARACIKSADGPVYDS